MRPTLQVSLHVEGRRCLVVGGSELAEERVVRLLEGRASVRLVAPEVTSPLARWAQEGRIEHLARAFEPGDLEGCFVALVCDERGDAIVQEARARGVLAYLHDRPDASDFSLPALVRRGALRMALSTGGESPALASRLRADFERIFDATFVAYLTWLGQLRERLRAEEPDATARQEQLRAAVEGFSVNAVLHYPEPFLRSPPHRS